MNLDLIDFHPTWCSSRRRNCLKSAGCRSVSPYETDAGRSLNYYRKVVDKHDLQIAYDETVLSARREAGDDNRPEGAQSAHSIFALETRTSRGVRRVRLAHNVLLAIGYYDHPNLIGVPGEDLPHVSHYYREPHTYYRKRVVVVGGGNSAAEAALECYRAGAYVTLAHRRAELKGTIKYWVKPDIENRIKEGSIDARMTVEGDQPTRSLCG